MGDKTIFAFDTSPFERGIKKVGDGMAGLQQGIGNMAKSVSKGVMSAVAKIGLIALAYKGVKSALREMPEIGKTFEMAKNVIFKNLFYPLRKAIFPLLQKFLNWVRDNRAMFVRWGQALVGIFNSITSTVSRLIEFGQSLGETFKGLIEKTFGAQIKTFGDFINLMTFKFAVLLEFIMSVLKPIVKFVGELFDRLKEPLKSIGDSIGKFVEGLLTANKEGHSLFTVVEKIAKFFGDIVTFVAEIVDGFLSGFLPAIKDIMTPIDSLVESFKNIFDSIFGSKDALRDWKETFGFLGKVVGGTLQVAFSVIADSLGTIELAIRSIKELLTGNVGKDTLAGALNFLGLGGFGQTLGLRAPQKSQTQQALEGISTQDALKYLGLGARQDDALITKGGKVVPISPDDNVLAAKDFGALGGKGNVNVSIDFKGMNVNIQQATQTEAEKFGESIVDTIRTQLNMELERAGAT